MSKEFMNLCVIERNRLLSKVHSRKKELSLYRQLFKTYDELEKCSDNPAVWKVCKNLITELVAPVLKKELRDSEESLELLTEAQQKGFLDISVEDKNG